MINMVISIEGVMITETSAVSFRQNLGEILNQVQYRHDSVVINNDGKPVAARPERYEIKGARLEWHSLNTECR